jgi:small subunit ribosomal protein S6
MAREYELVLMLDPEAPDTRREEIATGARQRIESAGELKHADDWGVRKMAYEIQQRNEADYRFYRFVAEGPVLADLDHTLKITDGVLRFRIFNVDSQAPVIVPPPAMQPMRAGRDPGESRGRGRGRRGEPPERSAAEAAAEEEAEQAKAAAAQPAPSPAESAPAPEAPAPEAPAPEAEEAAAGEPAAEGEAEQPAEGEKPAEGEQPEGENQ